MRQSGFDGLVKSALARDEIVYSGFSAAAVIAFDSTRVDPPLQVEPSRNLTVDREIAFYEANGIPYRTLPAWPIWLLLQRGPCCNGACARIPAIRLARQRLRGDSRLSPFRRRERGSPLRRPAQHLRVHLHLIISARRAEDDRLGRQAAATWVVEIGPTALAERNRENLNDAAASATMGRLDAELRSSAELREGQLPMGLVHRCEAGERARHRDARGPGDRDAGTMAIGSCGLGRRAGPVENRGAAAPPSPDIIGSQTPSVSEIATAASTALPP